MKDIFLNDSLKKSYMQDFQNLLVLERDFWKIDTEYVKTALININENRNIQTLYSKSSRTAIHSCEENYLKFCYSKQVELKIYREIIPFFILRYNDLENDCRCYYLFESPKMNNNMRDNDDKFGLGCIDDVNYFQVNCIQIFLECCDNTLSKQFWEELSQKLKSV